MTSISSLPNFNPYQSLDATGTRSDTKSSGQQSGQVSTLPTAKASTTATTSLMDEVSKITGDQSAARSDYASLHLGTKFSTTA